MMCVTFDDLQVIFWSITYILVIIYSFRYRKIGIPVVAIASNFAWETIALLQDILCYETLEIAHVAWFSLDLIIVVIYFLRCDCLYFKKWIFALLFIVELFCFSLIFKLSYGMLILCFTIDFVMAAEWFVYSFNKSYIANGLCISLCSTKLIGDLFAWLFYRQDSVIVDIIGMIVLLLNLGCVIVVIKRTITTNKLKQSDNL